MSELTVFLRGNAIDVKIKHVFVQAPMGTRADSDADCYGYSELEYDVLAVFDDDEQQLSKEAAEQYADDNQEEITDMIWSELERQA
jgi:hypothetical protein